MCVCCCGDVGGSWSGGAGWGGGGGRGGRDADGDERGGATDHNNLSAAAAAAAAPALRNPLSEQVHALRRQHAQRSMTPAVASDEMAEILAEVDVLRKRRLEDLQTTLGPDRAQLTLAQEAAAQELYGLREALCEGRRRIAALSALKVEEQNQEDQKEGPEDRENQENQRVERANASGERLRATGPTLDPVDRVSALASVRHNAHLVDTCEKILGASERDILETQHLGRRMLSLDNGDGAAGRGGEVGAICRAELQLAGRVFDVRTTNARNLARPFRDGWVENNSVIASALASSPGVQAWMSSERMHAAMAASKADLSRRSLAAQTAQLQLKEVAVLPEMSSAADKNVRTVVMAVRASHKALGVKLGEALEERVACTRQHVEALAETVASTVQP